MNARKWFLIVAVSLAGMVLVGGLFLGFLRSVQRGVALRQQESARRAVADRRALRNQPLPRTPVRKEAPAIAGDLFSLTNVPHLRLEIAEADIEVLRSYRWDWGRGMNMERTNVLGTVREGSRAFTNVAFHLKGAAGSFRSIDNKPALTLNFDKHADGQRFHGLQKIHLNNSVQDPTFISEQISRELFLRAGVPTPRATQVTVELNGRELGCYVLVEGWNKQFLKRHFEDARGNLYNGGFARDITAPLELNSGDHPDDRSGLDALIAAAQNADGSLRLPALEQVLDLDHFFTFMAVEVLLAHWDGYCMNRNNYRVFQNLTTGRMVFLPHGMDQMFGVARARPSSSVTPQMRGLVARQILSVPAGRRRHLDRLSEVFTNLYDVAALTNRVQALAAKVRPIVMYDPFGGFQFERGVMDLCDRIARRGKSVGEQLAQLSLPLEFDSSGSVALTGWDNRDEAGTTSFETRDTQIAIVAQGKGSIGSLRKNVLLDPGTYELRGRVRIERGFYENITRPGAALRVSGARDPSMVREAAEWTSLSHTFPVTNRMDIELVCEFRASNGKAWFDRGALQLLRKDEPSGR